MGWGPCYPQKAPGPPNPSYSTVRTRTACLESLVSFVTTVSTIFKFLTDDEYFVAKTQLNHIDDSILCGNVVVMRQNYISTALVPFDLIHLPDSVVDAVKGSSIIIISGKLQFFRVFVELHCILS